MESGCGKTSMNVQGDRLSNLPDDLIHKILSLVGIKLSVQTSALSSRWRYLWTSLPCLNFSSEDFKSLAKFSKFVTHVLSCRNNQIEVSSAKLSFHVYIDSQAFVKRILDYVISHNVKQLTVSCLPYMCAIELPLSLFSSQSLEHLTIAGHSSVSSVILTSTWELTSLTTLHIEYITFSDEVTAKDTGIFSKCANLKKLVLKVCSMAGSNGVDICHPGLSNLTLENGTLSTNVINVVAPQLKDLTVRNWRGLHLISAPELVSLRFEGLQSQWLKFSSYVFCSLENVDLCIIKECHYKPNKPDAHTIFDLLQQLHSVKYLTLNLEIFELLSPLMELISYQPSPFVNLKSLKVYPGDLLVKVLETIPAEVKKYLLDGSPSATFTEVSYEEMRALKSAESALNCMEELGVMLEKEKANIKTNIAHLDRVMTPVESQEPNMHEQDKMQINAWAILIQIYSCWKVLSDQIKDGKAKTFGIISNLCHIEELLTKLPASKSAQIETSFSRLYTEADVVMNAIMNSMKIQFDEKQSRLKEMKYAESALNYMVELREMLEHEKANMETNIAYMDRVMTPMECHEPNMHEQDKMQISKKMRNQIDSCWKDLRAQIEHGKSKTSDIISWLCRIEGLLTKLPESKGDQIEKSFSRLCTEADTVMNNIIDCVKIQSEEKRSRLSIYCHDLAMAVKPSF
ncbi:F-box domain, Leucine-rich repeat domain, L domain-like protein [Artemisia annua]|uniref:F-box domain, Leucine-rich repeat domain, L domain-like protein n=1 Tax=Artemisia annua TaxID=35608 RepID=A0A2U1Q6E1_ARTAN|nr:F-box domain, Leucine-rich repeat domain, L domain-like protein [Artemisia annua]